MLATYVQAQKINSCFGVGIIASNPYASHDDNYKFISKYSASSSPGAYIEAGIIARSRSPFSFAAMLNYTFIAQKTQTEFSDVNGSPIGSYDSTRNMHFVSIAPGIMFRPKISDKVRFYSALFARGTVAVSKPSSFSVGVNPEAGISSGRFIFKAGLNFGIGNLMQNDESFPAAGGAKGKTIMQARMYYVGIAFTPKI